MINRSNNASAALLPPRLWWAALIAILLLAGALRYTGYNFSLPYIDHVDEPAYNIAGRMMIDSGSAMPIGMHGYPPGIVTINYALMRFFQEPDTPPGTVIWMVRLISITFSMAVIVAVALLTYRIATPMAGLIAAAAWTVAPLIVEHSRFGTADNFVTFFTVIALFCTLTGTRFNREGWIFTGLGAALLAIIFKYQAIFALPLIVLIPLWRLTDPALKRGAVLMSFFRVMLVCAAFMFWLIVLFPALEATSSPDWSAPTARLTFPTPNMVLQNFLMYVPPLANDWSWGISAAGFGLLLWGAWRRKIDLLSLAAVALAVLAFTVGMSFYGIQAYWQIRQFIPAHALVQVLYGVGLSGWAFLIAHVLNTRTQNVGLRMRAVGIGAGVITAVMLIAALPDISDSITNAYQHTLHDRRNDLAHWMDITVPSGSYIADSENHKTFNREWGGYAGINQYPLFEVADLEDRTIDEWRAAGVSYAIVTPSQYAEWSGTETGRAMLAETLTLKIYPESTEYRGPSMVVLRLSPMQYPAQGQLGGIRLIGYDLTESQVTPGETITFTMYWQADSQPDAEYAVFNHLINPATGDLITQVDGDPMPDVRRPSTTWDDPTETLVSRAFTLTLPEDIPPGEYTLMTGFYRRDTGERLRSPDGADTLTLTPITVTSG